MYLLYQQVTNQKTRKDDVDIINAFQDQNAIDIFKKLTVVNKKGE